MGDWEKEGVLPQRWCQTEAVTSDTQRFRSRSFEVSWPHWLIKAELDRLIALNDQPAGTSRWADQCEWFIEEAFSSTDVLDEWKAHQQQRESWAPWEGVAHPMSSLDWLKSIRDGLSLMPTYQDRVPYWSERRNGVQRTVQLDFQATTRRFSSLVKELDGAGYFNWAFGQLCTDGDTDGALGADPIDEMHHRLGREGLWPVAQYFGNYDLDDLCDVIEFLADHVRRPTSRSYHSWNQCGWHFEGHDAKRGFQLYRLRVNSLLDQSMLGLTLTENARLETVAPSAVEDLVSAVRHAENVHDSDDMELEHALIQFRARGATTMDRRLAVVALAGILERRRALVKQYLFKKDEGALFLIANEFGIRHQTAKQQTDYDDALYLEWIFYWYVATINLTNRIVDSQNQALSPDELSF
ncbi:hypothetical protein GCM10010519_31740 [Streptomyces lactacystinicus]